MVYILVHREVSKVIILYDNVFNKHDLLCRPQGRCTWENPCLKARILNWKVRDGHKFVVKLRKKFYGWKKCHKNSLFLVVSFACPEEVSVTIHWLLKYYPCHNEFNNLEVSWKTSFYLLAVFCLFFLLNFIWFMNSVGNVRQDASEPRGEPGPESPRAGRVHRTQIQPYEVQEWTELIPNA